MRLEMAHFNRIGNAKFDASKTIADNGQAIVDISDDCLYKAGDVVTCIPLEDILYCTTTEDLEPYGFVRIKDNLWRNGKYDSDKSFIDLT